MRSAEAMLAVYDALWAAGEAHGITDYGSFAMNAMRMEKAFKGAGELTNEVTLPEADVMRFVKLDKNYVGITANLQRAQLRLFVRVLGAGFHKPVAGA